MEDLTYWANAGGPDGGVNEIEGKETFRKQLLQWRVLEKASACRTTSGLRTGSAAPVSEFYVTDLWTGHTYPGTYRQIVTYRDGKILGSHVYHDASALEGLFSGSYRRSRRSACASRQAKR